MLYSVSSIEIAPHYLETLEFDYAATYGQIPEERNSQNIL